MAEAKNSFIKSKMNKDLDERLIPNNEYRDALNIAVSRSEGSDVGAVESILGNVITARSTESGFTIIGTYSDEGNNRLYYFRTNHTRSGKAPLNAVCTIGYLNTLTQGDNVLVSGSFLNFSTQSRMYGISLIENQLFFTDNRNQPRKINIDQSLGHYTNEDQISVAKFAPYSPPSFINLRSGASYFQDLGPNVPLKPSTMSDAQDPSIVEIGIYKLSQENLAVKKYRNGDEIPQATLLSDWVLADTNQQGRWCYYENYNGNGVTYGLLYNKWAVVDPRGLAPIGHRIPTIADWNGIIAVNSTAPAASYKSQFLWDEDDPSYVAGDNILGTSILPSGYRENVASPNARGFYNLTTQTKFWTSDAVDAANNNASVSFDVTNTIDTTSVIPTVDGCAVRVLRDDNYNGWNGDPDFLSDRFVKFSYRFKFEDNEYSTVAPFSQDVFIPYQEGEFVNQDENQAFITSIVEFMQNSINNAVLNIELPCIDIITNYKISAIDIVFKQSDMQAYQIIETIKVDSNFISALNYTNIYQYSYQSTIPIRTLPAVQSVRVFDKVPVKALAQESSGNRIMYSNYLEGYSAPVGLDYYVGVTDKSAQEFIEYPQHSVKQNRNYQVGIVLSDKYGRQTDVVLSNYDGLLDSNGDPQPGSNYYSDYNPVSFSNSLQAWTGDNLALYYLQQIPEEANAGAISGYPGAYAQGDYYEVDTEFATPPSALYPFFNSIGTQCLIATAAQTTFTTIIPYADATNAANTFNILIDKGNGWLLQEPSTYSVNQDGTNVKLVFNTGLLVGEVVKFEVLYTSNKYYKYYTGAGSSTVRPLFPGWPTSYKKYYDIGRKLKGLYIDYTEIVSIDTVSDSGGVRAVTFFTKEEVASNYLFDDTPATRPEPSKLGQKNTYATYSINVNGFYIYKSVVKQQQQDYYNVYLPGIVNGYPIDGETKEQNEIAFVALINDNINKIPRNLQSVGPSQEQFTSDVSMWPRITNIIEKSSTTITYSTFNQQIDPESSSDKVDLIGTVRDLFPGLEDLTVPPASIPGKVNPFSIYSYQTKPYLAKVSTQKSVGLGESSYSAPNTNTGNYPYPQNMGLAVYETTPYVSPLELFYESSTADLISDLNLSIENENTNITGISAFSYSFLESMALNTQLTTDFFPVAGGVNLTNTTLNPNFTCFSYSLDGSLDTSTPQASRFVVNSGSQSGSYIIKTNDRFYAGSSAEPATFVDFRGKFLFTLTFIQSNGVQVSQSLTLQLENVAPIVEVPVIDITGLVTTSSPTIVVMTSGNPKESNKGQNGSARSNAAGDLEPWNTTFAPVGFTSGWSIDRIEKLSAITGNTEIARATIEPNSGTTNLITDWVQVAQGSNNYPTFQNGTAGGPATDEWSNFAITGRLNSSNANPGPLNEAGFTYTIYMNLRDTLQAQSLQVDNANSAKISYSVGAPNYSTQVTILAYSSNPTSSLNGQSMQASGTNNNRDYKFQFQNWTNQRVYLYMDCSISSAGVPGSQVNALMTTQFGSGASYGDGNATSFTDDNGAVFNIQSNTANSFTTNQNIPNTNQASGSSSAFIKRVQFASLQPFDAASGGLSPTNNDFTNLKASGLQPGQKSETPPVTQVYDFSGGAIVNLSTRCSIQNANPSSQGIFNIYWSYLPQASFLPTNDPSYVDNSNQLFGCSYVGNISPPFYTNQTGQPDGYPTVGMGTSPSQFDGP